MLGTDQRPGRTVPLGIPARPHYPRRIQHLRRPRWHSGLCSDVTTNTEAATSIGILVVALLIMLSVARFVGLTRERHERLDSLP